MASSVLKKPALLIYNLCMTKKYSDVLKILKSVDLRPTRQRLVLAYLLFSGEDRHVTAEQLMTEASTEGFQISQATIYNTLHQFREVGLLRQVVVEAGRCYFDTNTTHHHHFFVEDEGTLIDIPHENMHIVPPSAVPQNTNIDGIDVVIRLKKN